MAGADIDRNLLFGLFALQTDFITREGLVAAMRAWALEKHRPLGEILVESGQLDPAGLTLLEPIVAAHVERNRGEPAAGLDAFRAAGDLVAELRLTVTEGGFAGTSAGAASTQVDDPFSTRAPQSGEATQADDPHATRAPGGPASTLGEEDPHATRAPGAGHGARGLAASPAASRFSKVRDHAKGGLGVVFVARDGELNREVALKEIQDHHADCPDSRSRFMTEAEITGALEHPGIVPVYGLGRYEDGRPYYAMRFIRGKNLKDVIANFHGDRALLADPGARILALKKLLRRFLDVCNAIEYAHSRGVIHRDLKPDNVMLGEFGETLVVDWGLAKSSDRRTDEGDAKTSGTTLTPALTGNSSDTLPGSVLGTPAFMSPEQAEGLGDLIGKCSDVYCLGTTLYVVITGATPFTGRDLAEVLARVRQGEFARPREVVGWLDPALEAICLKAMSLRPENRYPSPQALADDLERWMADEPISARREDLGERLARWTRRHRAWTQSGAAALLTVGIVIVLANSMITRARRAELTIRDRERQRLAGVRDRVSSLVASGQEARVGGDLGAAANSLSEALSILATDRMPDLEGRARRLLSEVKTRLAAVDAERAAREKQRRFLELREEALYHGTLLTGDDPPTHLAATRDAALAALALYGIGGPAGDKVVIPDGIDRADLISHCYELFLLLSDVALRVLPDPAEPASRLAVRKVAGARQALALLDRADSLGLQTCAIHRRRAAALDQAGDAEGARRQAELARLKSPTRAFDFFLVGLEKHERGDLPGSVSALEEALRREPTHFWARYFLAVSALKLRRPAEARAHLTACAATKPDLIYIYLLRGYANGELGDYGAAEADFARAEAIDPDEPGLYLNRGAMQIRRDRLDLAEVNLRRAIALRPQHHQAHVLLAVAYHRRRQYAEALAELDRAIALAPALPELYHRRARVDFDRREAGLPGPESEEARRAGLADLARAIELEPADSPLGIRLHAEDLLERGRYAEAIAAFDRYAKLGPVEADVYRARGLARAKLGDYPGAVADYDHSLELDPNASNIRARRGWAYYLAARPLALQEFQEAIRLNPDNGDAYSGRGFLRALNGDHQGAVADAEQAVRLGPPIWETPFNAACIFAQAAERLASAGTGPDREMLIRGDLDRSIALIRAALAADSKGGGLVVWRNVLADSSLEFLRRDPAFARLKGDLEAARP